MAYIKGQFKNGKIHGAAEVYDKDHHLKYDNEKQIYEDDTFYIGHFRKWKRNGNGILYNKDNEIIRICRW